MLVAVILGARGLAEILAYGLGAFATAGIVRQFVLGIRGRRRALGESRAVALGRATRSNPRLYGGLVVHFGVVLIAVVLAASSAYGANRDVKLKKGESATVSGYTVTYLGSHTCGQRPEDHGVRRHQGREGRPRARHVRAGDLHVPEQHRGHRHAVGAHRAGRRRVPHAGLVAERASARSRSACASTRSSCGCGSVAASWPSARSSPSHRACAVVPRPIPSDDLAPVPLATPTPRSRKDARSRGAGVKHPARIAALAVARRRDRLRRGARAQRRQRPAGGREAEPPRRQGRTRASTSRTSTAGG